jgi:K+-sensing histidine kinase KdpD
MSHEIRTPFNAVIACSVFLLDTQLTANQKEYCETIHTSATELLRIIDDILGINLYWVVLMRLFENRTWSDGVGGSSILTSG